jgi:hypothetical protein
MLFSNIQGGEKLSYDPQDIFTLLYLEFSHINTYVHINSQEKVRHNNQIYEPD